MPIHPQRKYDLEDETVGRTVREMRELLGLHQSEIAEHSGIEVRIYSRIERGDRPLRVPELAALATAFGVPAGQLMGAMLGNRADRKSIGLQP
ncbi:Predicted transcriptional regulator (plasmid) [Tsukamurella tyrosinosolvens]|uniref:Helix-turn-helix domain-containing protein n=1 Tax=Tsukamurella tyrosinosolvens TaxID=57704 RepID=A0A1H4ULD3_TSUTY|nr:helix-turn-helix transcriptional regulator [Tsukamurella tyrosinosolvens]KXO99052.1 hypothetical protein AXK58_24160 [Tsukamurella tyrosinosolvens]SEC69188.1 Helix-turn-helix domain-containing protein [Tsukamurella tyrosinosolvens]VEH94310.1 Predicted transcriptional regulator [Tsukamurella tyrosinosolvens]